MVRAGRTEHAVLAAETSLSPCGRGGGGEGTHISSAAAPENVKVASTVDTRMMRAMRPLSAANFSPSGRLFAPVAVSRSFL
jgi:hypothetical protein